MTLNCRHALWLGRMTACNQGKHTVAAMLSSAGPSACNTGEFRVTLLRYSKHTTSIVPSDKTSLI